MAKILLDHVSKIFGTKVVAVDDVTLEVKDGELLVLLGPSGSGKTTLLRLVAGLERPTSGNLYIGDQLVNEVSPGDRDVAMVFQSYALYPHMKVYDNIAFPLKVRKVAQDEIDKKVEETVRMLQIKELLDRYPKQLSGGQQQRVALARAIIRDPKVFLFDEPLSNLDAKLRVMARGFLKKLQKDLGVTSIYVTHDQAEAMSLADRIAIINKGSVFQLDEPSMIYRKPVNTFVAGFIGSPPMNFIEATLAEDHGLSMSIGALKIELPPFLSDAVRPKLKSSEVIIGARPEDLRGSKLKPKGEKIVFDAEAYVVEHLGNQQYVTIELEGNRIMATADPEEPIRIGDHVWINIDPSRLHLFDRKSEESLT